MNASITIKENDLDNTTLSKRGQRRTGAENLYVRLRRGLRSRLQSLSLLFLCSVPLQLAGVRGLGIFAEARVGLPPSGPMQPDARAGSKVRLGWRALRGGEDSHEGAGGGDDMSAGPAPSDERDIIYVAPKKKWQRQVFRTKYICTYVYSCMNIHMNI